MNPVHCTIGRLARLAILVLFGLSAAWTIVPLVAQAQTSVSQPAQVQNAIMVAQEHHPGTLLVGFKSGVNSRQRVAVHSTLGTRPVHSYQRIPVEVVQVSNQSDLKQLIAAYQALPEVAYVEPNYIVRAEAVPNDPHFSQLWGLHNTGQTGGTSGADIRAVQAWGTATGSRDIIVGVIDTGIEYTHPDLAGNMWRNPAELHGTAGVDDDGNGIVDDLYGARWTDGSGVVTSGNPLDDQGHGTHCAGTIGGVGNNGVGVAGVTWQVSLMALKFLDTGGSGYTADAISALEYAINTGAHLTSNSWGGGGYSQAFKDMITNAAAANQVFVAAAGNNCANNDTYPHYPSSYDNDNIISVAASDHNDRRVYFSNYGPVSVDLAAPGQNILSTFLNSGYESMSGTSMAAPHVAGAAALLLSQQPSAQYQDVRRWIFEGVTQLPAWTNLVAAGGRLDIAASLALLDDLHITPAQDLSASGWQGGPFTPNEVGYVLTNCGAGILNWTAAATQDWLLVEPAMGTLIAGGSATLEVRLAASVTTLEPGEYSEAVTFANTTSGRSQQRMAFLRVRAIPGVIAVEDSIPPLDDFNLPFGMLFAGQSLREHITVRNDDPTHDLMLQAICKTSVVRDTGDEGTSDPVPAHDNSVLYFVDYNGGINYFPDALNALGYTVTTASSWSDFNDRLKYPDYAYAVALNQNYEIGLNPTTMCHFIMAGGRVIFADWRRNATIAALFGASYTSGINQTPVTITDQQLAAGVTNPMPLINPGWGTWSMGLSACQSANSLATFPGGNDAIVQANDGRTIILGFLADTLGATDGQRCCENLLKLVANASRAFQFDNLPCLPAMVPPGGRLTFDMLYAPEAPGEHAGSVMIKSNDAERPLVEVTLAGRAIRDIVTVDLPGLPAGARPLRMIRIPAGTSTMGSPDADRGRYANEEPLHAVAIGSDFYLGETEITQAQWQAVMGSNPASGYGVGHDYPVYNVSWNDIRGTETGPSQLSNGFIDQLNTLGQGTFRLPSEAEWEYACRVGTTSRFSFGDNLECDDACGPCALADQYMWWCGNNSQDQTEPVGSKSPNAFGLFDLHGNVWEWCEDDWHGDYSGAPSDGTSWVDTPRAVERVARGGGWYDDARLCRAAFRGRLSPAAPSNSGGLRVYRQAEPFGSPTSTDTPTPIDTPLPCSYTECFNGLPAWTSEYDALWGNAREFAIQSGGQEANCLQATGSGEGSSARVLVYNIGAGSLLGLSIFMRCPSDSGLTYWMETAYKLGTYTAASYDKNPGGWTLIKKFEDAAWGGPDGNGNMWTQHTASVHADACASISIGYKLGSLESDAPMVGWDSFQLDETPPTPTDTPTATNTDPATDTFTATPTCTVTDTATDTLPDTPTHTPLPCSHTECFNVMPAWTSAYDAPWGNTRNFSIQMGGQEANCLQATGSGEGSSARVLVYGIGAGSVLDLSIYMRCPSDGGLTYWMETAYKLGTHTAAFYDRNPGSWAWIKKFEGAASGGPDGTADMWTLYTANVNAGANTSISIGYKLGSLESDAPTVGWDSFRLDETPATPTDTPSITDTASDTSTPADTPTITDTGTQTSTSTVTDTFRDTSTDTRTSTDTYTRTSSPTPTNTLPPPALYVDPVTDTRVVGDQFVVRLCLNAQGNEVGGMGVFLQYNTAALRFDTGSLHRAVWDNEGLSCEPREAAGPGVICFFAMATSPVTSNEVLVASVTFTATGAGVSDYTYLRSGWRMTEIVDIDIDPFPVYHTLNGSVTVLAPTSTPTPSFTITDTPTSTETVTDTHTATDTPEDTATATPTENERLYLIIDLSGGPEASSYPLEWASSIVVDGTIPDQYRTTKLALRYIPAGSFVMGSSTGELGRISDEMQHAVQLTLPCYAGVFEVTQRQWFLVTGTDPATSKGERRPVEQVSYEDIRGAAAGVGWPADIGVDPDSFLGKLRARTGMQLDLPTEAQWEYACRAETITALNSGKNLSSIGICCNMNEAGRYSGNRAGGQHTTVGMYLPNSWGLYDTHGNVWEWCLDWYAPYPGDVTDPPGPPAGEQRVLRGGGWNATAGQCRAARRIYSFSGLHSNVVGLRLVTSPAEDTPTPTDAPTNTPDPNPYVSGWQGDANGSGGINSSDYFAVKDALNKSYTCQTVCRGIGDANGGGWVNSTDYFTVKANLNNLYGPFPCIIRPATACH